MIDNSPEKISDVPTTEHQTITIEKSEISKPVCITSSMANEALNQLDSRPITTHKHSSTSVHFVTPTHASDNNLITSHQPQQQQQHFSYPYFLPPGILIPSSIKINNSKEYFDLESPPSSTRTLSTSSCNSIVGNSFYNTMISGQQYGYDKDSRR